MPPNMIDIVLQHAEVLIQQVEGYMKQIEHISKAEYETEHRKLSEMFVLGPEEYDNVSEWFLHLIQAVYWVYTYYKQANPRFVHMIVVLKNAREIVNKFRSKNIFADEVAKYELCIIKNSTIVPQFATYAESILTQATNYGGGNGEHMKSRYTIQMKMTELRQANGCNPNQCTECIDSLENAFNSMCNEIDELSQISKSFRLSQEKTEKEHSVLTDKYNEARSKLNKLNTENADLKNKNNEMAREGLECDENLKHLSDIHRKDIDVHNGQRQKLESDMDNHRIESLKYNQESKREIQKLENEIHSLKDEKKKNIENLKENMTQRENQLQYEHDNTLSDYKEQMSNEWTDLNEKCNNQHESLLKSQDTIRKLEKILSTTTETETKSRQKNQELNVEIQTLKCRIQSLEIENKKTMETYEENMRRKQVQLQHEYDDNISEHKKKSSSELLDIITKYDDRCEFILKSNENIKQLKESLSTTTETGTELKQKNQELNVNIQTLENRIQSLEIENKKTMEIYEEDMRQKEAQLQIECDGTISEYKEQMSIDLNTLNERNDEQLHYINAYQIEILELKRKLSPESSQKDIENLNEKYLKLQKENQNLYEKISYLEDKY